VRERTLLRLRQELKDLEIVISREDLF